ncbi:hypothetical protein HNQ94_003860, partial [Salirhabdus euzebyi]|nr:hypothetical protein [Salirhabdus euzebyi]
MNCNPVYGQFKKSAYTAIKWPRNSSGVILFKP